MLGVGELIIYYLKKKEFLQTVEYEFFDSANTAFTVTIHGS